MLLIGLTGSIATGKSTVSALLAGAPHGLPVIDADLLARQVVEPGTKAYRRIVAYFGPTTPDLLLPGPEGQQPLNRPALGRCVFGDAPEQRRQRAVLDDIVHPAVRAAMYRQLLRCYLAGYWAVVLDVPLLLEASLDVLCGCVLVVAVHDPALQMARLRARNPYLSPEDAQNRVHSQVDVREKARRCEARNSSEPNGTRGIVLWNDSSHEELAQQVTEAMQRIRAASPPRWHRLLLLCPPLGLVVAAWAFWKNVQLNRQWKRQEQLTRAAQ